MPDADQADDADIDKAPARKGQEQGSKAGIEAARSQCREALLNVTAVLRGLPLTDEPETVQEAIDACTDICCSCASSGQHTAVLHKQCSGCHNV